ncbi:CheF family chemotaxis protein [Natronocalculus amylovorans]|uniref:Taxis protein CheF n=1 Tax=Natronocalculus amylovorans TaxID=2917812 RepID=A0AAE3FVW2_9EURY|nr:CheF family chemotaxis protein [Natronocalculus amylovorans]MCL9816120.1 CheF family chemotaxis protein [Natronocalculus amylovorans]NUE01361.1 chemotaxis protein CheF1 [Halorubraceae archaeon YAN]
MSEGEYKVADTKGKFAQAVKDGRAVNDVSWTQGRILLSNRRVILIGNSGKRTIPLSKVQGLSGRHDPNQTIAQVSGYVSLKLGEDVLLISAADHEAFETDIYRAVLDQKVIQAKHPAVAGGVVQDTKWEKARLKVEEDAIAAALESGKFVRFDLDDISGVGTEERTVNDEKRTVIEVKHTEGQTNVQSHLTGERRVLMFLKAFLREGERRSRANVDLSESEKEVLMALYSGVSPFEIPAFIGMDVDRVEEIFEKLVELDVLEEVRVRREVALNSRGRNIASEAMNQQ